LPDSFESLVSVIPVLTFFAVTSTPGINAPVESATVPLRTALTWANAEFEAATYSKKIDKLTSFFTVLSSIVVHLDFCAGIYHFFGDSDNATSFNCGGVAQSGLRSARVGLFRGLAGLDSSAQERLNPDFGRECPVYGTLVGDIQQARPLL